MNNNPETGLVLESGMRCFAVALLLATFPLSAQDSEKRIPLPTFPLPSKWLGGAEFEGREGLGPSFLKALAKEFHCTSCEEIGTSRVSLGSLGPAVVAVLDGEEHCGATGNCDFYVFYMYKGKIRSSQIDNGWTYALVKGQKKVPDLVFMANTSCCAGVATRYSFVAGQFVRTGCDDVELNESIESAYILNPKQVIIKSCH